MHMPVVWRPEHTLFPHQVGLPCPPFDIDATPSGFFRIALASVGVLGWRLHAQNAQKNRDPLAPRWGDGGAVHAKLAQSMVRVPQKRKYVEPGDSPDPVRQVHRRMKPHYDRLYAHRITL